MEGIDHGELEEYVADDGTRLGFHVHRCGQLHPRAVVMLHGLASNSTRFSELCANTRLRESWDLLRPDLRGHGASMYRGRITRRIWCEDLLSLLDSEGDDQAVFLGHSLGGQIAMDLAVLHPERVSGLILIDPVFPGALRGTMGVIRRLGPLNHVLIGIVRVLESLGMGRRHYPYRDLHALDTRTRSHLQWAADDRIARMYMNPCADLHYLPLSNYLQDMREVVRPLPDPARIRAPVLVLRSAGAGISNPTVVEERLARFPSAACVTIDADHWLLTERPDEARRAIEVWCDDLFPRS